MQVAFGKVDITPLAIRPENNPGQTVKMLTSGYVRNLYARGVLDPLHVHGVLIEDTILGNVKKRLLFLSIDTMKIPLKCADYIKERIQKFYPINPNQILVHATHTHQAPDLTGEYHWPGIPGFVRGIMFGINRNDKYIIWISNQILKLVGQLLHDLQPCKMAFTKTVVNEDVIINRRHPTRRSKSPLGIIAFKHADSGELLGFMVNFTGHPTTLGPSNDTLSADYPGRLVTHVEELTGGKVKAAFFGGAGGDINPIATCGTDFDHLKTNQILGQNGTKKEMWRMGNFLGERALEVAKSIPDDQYYDKLEYSSYVRTIWVPVKDFKKYHSDKQIQSTLVRFQNRFLYLVKRYFLMAVVLAITHDEDNKPNFPPFAIKQRGSKLNVYSKITYLIFHLSSSHDDDSLDFSIIGTPGEPFENIGAYLLQKSITAPETTLIFQHLNDWFGYFFDLSEYTEQGGMEPLESLTPVAGYYIKKEYTQFLKEIKLGLTAGHN
ncbi:MAG TPA: hypothetical protein VKM55_04400 [Candidatus Lokiarchaeia archaeon]|nr:hypothetical protein [Candidatus Lokiarchaeia archaeon]